SGRVLQETIVDQATNAFVRGSSGRIEQLIEERGTTAFGRDARDRITSVAYPDGGSLEFTRDAAGRRLQVTDHTGFQVRYAYDSKGRLAAVNDADDVAVVNYTYDAAGRLAQETRRNQTATAYTYDANGRMAEIVHLGPDGQPQERFTYICDANGKCRSVTDLAGNVTRYTYDAAGRLVHVEYPGGDFERFTYDAADNRLAVSTPGGNTAYTANSFQQYVQVGDQTLTHDPAGSLETDGTRTFTYDGKDRLLSVATTEGDNQDYAYDSLGSRWQASVNGETTRFLNDPSGIGWVFAEMDELGEIRCHQVLGLRPVAWVDASGEWYFYGFDRSGHTRLVTDSAGQVVNRYTYGAFGGEREVVEAVANPCRFGGAWGARTEANGLIFLRHRYYDPALGRFLSPDPIGLAGGLHPFTYAGNDPVNRTDRQGLVEAEDAVDLFFDDPEDVLEDWLIPDPIDIVVDYTVDRVVDLTKLPPQDVQRLQDMNTIGNVGREVLGDDYRLFDQQTREKAEEGLKDTVKDVIKGIYGVLTGDTLLDVVKDSVKDNLKEGLKPVEPDPAPVLDPSIWELAHKPISELVAPGDPNEKDGWGSLGQRGVAVAGEELRYIVYFENDPKIATAPAQEVRITDALSADLDWASFRLTEIAWGDVSLTPPPGTAEFSQRVTVPDHRPDSDLSWWVDVAASVDAQGVAQWSFQTLDPATGDLPEDALAGFLPVNDDSGRGEGHVAFSIRVRPDAAPGTGLSNYATIQFDVENPIETGAVVFTVVAQQSSHIRTAAVTDGLLILEVQDLLPGIAVTVEQTPDLAVWQELQTTVAAEGITTITVP
ncbi:MAG: RHS repeat-associated core domain-containing protein, partial [Verrucomicrobiae bacterium]|nr:RHS repeat-associated core domain-containing protein [Verrucomicrobiae bacterium]